MCKALHNFFCLGTKDYKPTVTGIIDRFGCQWFSRSFKIDDFHLT